MNRRSGEILRPVATFALSGLAVLVLVAIAGAYALRSLSTSEAVRDAKRVTTITGPGSSSRRSRPRSCAARLSQSRGSTGSCAGAC